MEKLFAEASFPLQPIDDQPSSAASAEHIQPDTTEPAMDGDSGHSTPSDPDSVPETTPPAAVLPIPQRPEEPSDDVMIRFLRSHMLLVFKRCERKHRSDSRTDVMRITICRAAAKALNTLFNSHFKKRTSGLEKYWEHHCRFYQRMQPILGLPASDDAFHRYSFFCLYVQSQNGKMQKAIARLLQISSSQVQTDTSVINKKLSQPSKLAYQKLFGRNKLMQPYLKFAFSLVAADAHRFRRSFRLAVDLVF